MKIKEIAVWGKGYELSATARETGGQAIKEVFNTLREAEARADQLCEYGYNRMIRERGITI